jgi:polysaccharide export outer membrane protein
MTFRSCATLLCALAMLSVTAGCKTTGEFVWADSYTASPAPSGSDYLLQPGDVITIRVWNQDSITTKTKIRPDGKVSLPFVSDVPAAGATPTILGGRIQTGLKDYIVNPVVTVTLDEARPLQVSVIGEVGKPGSYSIEPGSGVLQALASAAGMTPFADRDRIMVIRQKPDGSGATRIRFTFTSLAQLEGRAATFRLRSGDVVVVE